MACLNGVLVIGLVEMLAVVDYAGLVSVFVWLGLVCTIARGIAGCVVGCGVWLVVCCDCIVNSVVLVSLHSYRLRVFDL